MGHKITGGSQGIKIVTLILTAMELKEPFSLIDNKYLMA
jgi:hypothetical protein